MSRDDVWLFFSAFYHYQLPSGQTLSVGQVPAWCHDCARFVLAEDIPSAECLLEERRRVKHATPDDRDRLSFVGVDHADLLTELDAFERLIEMRQSPPRCLVCSSTRIARMLGDDVASVDPVTGATMNVKSRGWTDQSPDVRHFDPEGLPIEAS